MCVCVCVRESVCVCGGGHEKTFKGKAKPSLHAQSASLWAACLKTSEWAALLKAEKEAFELPHSLSVRGSVTLKHGRLL